MPEQAAPPRPWLWAAAFVVAMFGVAFVNARGWTSEPWRSILSLGALSLVVPMVLSARRKARADGALGTAMRTYNNRALAMMGLYMLAIFAFVGLREAPGTGIPAALLALLPALPLLGMIWAMYRYLAEETDEYLRHRAIIGALFGLGAVLVTGTVWGFLETAEAVPHVPGWWVFPLWALGFAAGQGWCWLRGR